MVESVGKAVGMIWKSAVVSIPAATKTKNKSSKKTWSKVSNMNTLVDS